MSELKDCPFCNGWPSVDYDKDHQWEVQCSDQSCLAAVRGFTSRDAAIAAWNRRAPLPTIPHKGEVR